MVPYSAYFDASGTSDSAVITVAGFVSTVKKWERFEKEWNAVLNREGIKVFHMTDFVSSRKDFAKGWRNETERRRMFIGDLANCLYRNVNKSFRTTLVVQDFKKVNSRFLLTEHDGTPYSLCALMSVFTLRLWAKRKGVEKHLVYYFEDGDKGKGHFERSHKGIWKTAPLFATKEEATPLQAADFAAWKLKTAVQEAIKTDHTIEKGRELLRSIEILKKIPKDGGVINEEVILRWCARYNVKRRN